VEIGSGPGHLTLLLALSGATVTGLELDTKFDALHRELLLTNSALEGRLSWSYTDALEFDYVAAANAAHQQNRRFLIAGNIPYQITSPLIMGILESGAEFDCMVLMMQREVAERLAATPGGKLSGSITIKVQHYCDVEAITDVPAESFLPPPEVESRVLRFRRRNVSCEAPRFFRLVETGFMQRRKTLPNSISAGRLGYTREEVQAALEQIGFAPTVRAEQLGRDDFAALQERLDSIH
jgi:16S rRNA (adenine1518-N6/adenine1519-N6)-dimethyltransferase